MNTCPIWQVPLEARRLRCRFGDGPDAPTTTPVRVDDDLVVCPAATSGAALGDVPMAVALNAADYVDTGMRFRYYEQPASFARALEAEGSAHCADVFDSRCASGLHPTGGVNEGGTSVTIFGAGFVAFTASAELASCQWGGQISTPTAISDTQLVCPTPPRAFAAGVEQSDEMVPLRP